MDVFHLPLYTKNTQKETFVTATGNDQPSTSDFWLYFFYTPGSYQCNYNSAITEQS